MIVEEELRSPGKYNENEFFARHVWQYRITITNKSEEPFRLVARKWKVHYNGETTEAKGRGVVGQHPMLAPESPIFKVRTVLKLLKRLRLPDGHFLRIRGSLNSKETTTIRKTHPTLANNMR